MALYLRQIFVSAQYLPIGRISPNFIYAFILARSSLGLLLLMCDLSVLTFGQVHDPGLSR